MIKMEDRVIPNMNQHHMTIGIIKMYKDLNMYKIV